MCESQGIQIAWWFISLYLLLDGLLSLYRLALPLLHVLSLVLFPRIYLIDLIHLVRESLAAVVILSLYSCFY